MLQKYRNYKCFDPNKTILDSSHRKMNKPVTLSNFMFSKKATKIHEIFTVDLTHNVKSTVKISSNFVAFWENINFSRMKKWENPTLHCAYFHRGGARRLKLENGSLTNELQWSCRWFIFLRKLSPCKPMQKKNFGPVKVNQKWPFSGLSNISLG